MEDPDTPCPTPKLLDGASNPVTRNGPLRKEKNATSIAVRIAE
jgi:hypothetical protein